MMIGSLSHSHPTVQIPPQWDPFDDLPADTHSPFSLRGNSFQGGRHALSSPIGSPDYPFTLPDSFGSLQRYLPSNESAAAAAFDPEFDVFDEELADLIPLDAFSCDSFRMYEFKVRRCTRGRSHDWTECPFAHPGEKARRRDPRKYGYSGTACSEFRKGSCRKGDACEFAHGVFECWLHPDRYRTQPCKDGLGCRRRICFFAHAPEQLRVANLHSPRTSFNSPDSYDGSPLRRSFDSYLSNPGSNMVSSPPVSPPSSPPMSPLLSSSYNEVLSGMRQLQLAKAANLSPTTAGWGLSGVGSSPRGSSLRPGFFSLPATPTRIPSRPSGFNQFDQCAGGGGEEPVMERVESGRDLRAKIYAKLSKENSFGPVNEGALTDPDVGWISDLIQ